LIFKNGFSPSSSAEHVSPDRNRPTQQPLKCFFLFITYDSFPLFCVR
uniref:Ovule protein n=1 Tax=Brugia timori TaxID=42155 RepID=A0A0R3QZT7_9BILA